MKFKPVKKGKSIGGRKKYRYILLPLWIVARKEVEMCVSIFIKDFSKKTFILQKKNLGYLVIYIFLSCTNFYVLEKDLKQCDCKKEVPRNADCVTLNTAQSKLSPIAFVSLVWINAVFVYCLFDYHLKLKNQIYYNVVSLFISAFTTRGNLVLDVEAHTNAQSVCPSVCNIIRQKQQLVRTSVIHTI